MDSKGTRTNETRRPQTRVGGPMMLSVLAVALLVACGGASTPVPDTPIPATRAPAATNTAEAPVATSTPEAPAVSPQFTRSQLRVFNLLWGTVRDEYLHPDYNGVDWDDVYRRYEARIKEGLEYPAFHEAMREMLQELGDEHTYYLSPQEVAQQAAELRGELDFAGIGIMVQLLPEEGGAVIFQVMPGSPAEQAGLRSHDSILAVDGVPAGGLGEDLFYRIRGPEGTEVRLQVQTPGQEPREVPITRAPVEFQDLIDAYRLPGTDVGYLLIPSFWEQGMGHRVAEALEALMAEGDLAGLVVDMRINGGGLEEELHRTLSLFTSGELGAFVSRDGRRLLVASPLPTGNSQEVPLVILVGRETASYGEMFSGVLQEQGRARVVGRTTAGSMEIVWETPLQDGSAAWIVRETFRPPSGADWERTGIVPDLEIPLDWEDFVPETDEQLQAALDWLQRGEEP
jgi:C-terminal peptidase prc